MDFILPPGRDAGRDGGSLGPPIALLGLAMGLWAFAFTRPPEELRAWLESSTFWSLEGLALLAAASTVGVWRVLLGALRRAKPAYGVIASISVLAVTLSGWMAPHTNRIYFDEQIYQHLGQSLNDLHSAEMCHDGAVEYGRLQCWSGEINKEPYGYPHILSALYRLTGTNDWVAHHWNVAIAGLLVWIVALTATLLWQDPLAGWFAGLAAAIFPEQLLWCHTAAAEPSAELFAALSVLAMVLFVRTRSAAALFWCLAITAYGVHMRPESLLVVVPLAACMALEARDQLTGRRFWWCLASGALLATPLGVQLAATRHESWGAQAARLSTAYVLPNLSVNGWFYVWDERFPAIVTVLAAVGLVSRFRTGLPMLAWFGTFTGLYLLFYAGSYDYGADVRYSLLTYPPLAILAGAGVSGLRGHLDPRAGIGVTTKGATAILLLWFTWSTPLVRAVGEEAWGARADVEFARTMLPALPPNSVVLTHNPNMFLVWGQNAAQLSIAADDPQYARQVLFSRYSGGVFLHWNFWCNVDDPEQSASCRKALDAFPHALLREARVRGNRYAFYRLSP